MVFHENRLLADNSHEISYLIFFRKSGIMSQNLSSPAVVIGALRVKSWNFFFFIGLGARWITKDLNFRARNLPYL